MPRKHLFEIDCIYVFFNEGQQSIQDVRPMHSDGLPSRTDLQLYR